MITRCSMLLLLCFSIGVSGCSDDAEEDGDTGSGGSPTSASSGSGATGNASSSSGSGASGATGGGGGQGAEGGSGGGSGEITVEMTVTPDTMAAGDTVSATITVQNFVLEDPAGQGNEDGHGHFHIYLDDATGIDYLVADAVEMVDVEIPASTPPGPHTLRVSLGENNHAPLNPPVEDIVDITVTR